MTAMVLQVHDDITLTSAKRGGGDGVLPYQRIFEALPHVVWIANAQGEIDYVSAPWAESPGSDHNAASESLWRGICHPLDHASITRHWREALLNGEPFQADIRLRKSEFAPYEWGLMRVAPLRDSHAAVERWIGTFTPLEAHREYERVLTEEIVKRDEFLAMLVHELHNSTTVLHHGLALLHGSNSANEGEILALRLVKRQSDQLESLIEDLRDMAKLVRGKLSFRRQPVKLDEVVRGVLADTTIRFAELNHRVDVELPAGEISVEGDPARLVQIFTNILVNSHKFTPVGGAIHVRGSIVNGRSAEVVIEVTDNGSGIPPNALPDVFEIFSQGGIAELGRTQGGLGIGLALVRQLVELHGGAVTAASPGVNLGTTITVRLPIWNGGVPPPVDSPVKTGESPLRILIVDDDHAVASLLCEFLRVPGRAVRVAGDGIDALQSAINFKPELILLDLGLPRFDGCQVVRRLRALPDFAATPIIALDDSGLPPDEVLRSGFTDRIPKPVSAATLRHVIEERLIVGRPAAHSPE